MQAAKGTTGELQSGTLLMPGSLGGYNDWRVCLGIEFSLAVIMGTTGGGVITWSSAGARRSSTSRSMNGSDWTGLIVGLQNYSVFGCKNESKAVLCIR